MLQAYEVHGQTSKWLCMLNRYCASVLRFLLIADTIVCKDLDAAVCKHVLHMLTAPMARAPICSFTS